MSNFELALVDQIQVLRLALEVIRDLRPKVPATKTVAEMRQIAAKALNP